jgi:hypothetical protein
VPGYAREKYLQNVCETCDMNFGFLIFPGIEELDLVGLWEMISLWSKFVKGLSVQLRKSYLDYVILDSYSICSHRFRSKQYICLIWSNDDVFTW